MQIIFLARHGTHDEVGRALSGRSEIALNAAGLDEAQALARALRTVPLASIHASPRTRTRQTAAPIARDHGLSVTVTDALDEIDFGAFTGRSFASLDGDPEWNAWNTHRATARCPGGESMTEVVSRALTYLRAIPPASTPALCVTHCDVIRGIVAVANGTGLDRLYDLPCDPGSLTELALDGDTIRVIALNRRPDQDAAPA